MHEQLQERMNKSVKALYNPRMENETTFLNVHVAKWDVKTYIYATWTESKQSHNIHNIKRNTQCRTNGMQLL